MLEIQEFFNKWKKEVNYNKALSIIKKNNYVINTKSNKKKDINSLCYLLQSKELSQSDNIKLGNALEKIFSSIILHLCNFTIVNIKSKNEKDKKETDHLFMNEKEKIIYYAELKSNLNLDSEKLRATCQKCIQIKEDLTKKYSNYETKMYLVTLRYYTKDIIPNNIIKKYKEIENNIIGINEYLQIFNITIFNNEHDYITMLEEIVYQMFDK